MDMDTLIDVQVFNSMTGNETVRSWYVNINSCLRKERANTTKIN